MAVTRQNCIDAVNNEIENYPLVGFAETLGVGTEKTFNIAPMARFVDEDVGIVVTLDDVLLPSSEYTMDYHNGSLVLDSPLAQSVTMRVSYSYVAWPNDLITSAIESGLSAMFPHFWVGVPEVVTTDGEKTEYTLTTPNVFEVRQIESSSTSAPPWRLVQKRSSYEKFLDGDDYTLRFYTAPASGGLRVHCVCRGSFIDEEVAVTIPATVPDPLKATLNIPDRALAPLVSFSAFYLLSQKTAPRLRADIAVTTTGGGNLSPRQMNDAANMFYTRYQMQLVSSKMRPWAGA